MFIIGVILSSLLIITMLPVAIEALTLLSGVILFGLLLTLCGVCIPFLPKEDGRYTARVGRMKFYIQGWRLKFSYDYEEPTDTHMVDIGHFRFQNPRLYYTGSSNSLISFP